jgi:hypothetical protein
VTARAYVMPRTAAAEDLHSRLDYQCAVNRALLATTRPAGTRPDGLLSPTEMDEMETAYTLGLSAAGFAARLMARDKAGAP